MIQSHEELNEINGQSVQREIVSRETNEVYPVISTSLGKDTVEFTTDRGVFSFKNTDNDVFGDDTYFVRKV